MKEWNIRMSSPVTPITTASIRNHPRTSAAAARPRPRSIGAHARSRRAIDATLAPAVIANPGTLIRQSGVEIKPIATGAAPSTYTQVMSGQIDIGWSAPPYVVDEARTGKVRVIARESDLEAFRNQTVRMNFANMTTITDKADQLKRFIDAYEETLNFMYADPAGLKIYAEFAGITEDQAKYIRDTYFPKNNLIPRRISGLDNAMADAVAMKFISAPLDKEQLAEFLKHYVK